MKPTINFVMPNREGFSGALSFDKAPNEAPNFFINSEWAWIVQTFLELRDNANLTITRSSIPSKSAINIMHCDDYLHLRRKHTYFVVQTICDRQVYFPADINITQNPRQNLPFFSHKTITHWPQPGLIPRKGKLPHQKKEILVSFYGIPENSINISEIIPKIPKQSIRTYEPNPKDWANFSEVDIIIAIRTFSKKSYNHKPPTKLINAWLAETPIITGDESAYRWIGSPGQDYLVAKTPDQAKKKIKEILATPAQYTKLVENGKIKSTTYNRSKIRTEWESLLLNFVITPNKYQNHKTQKLIKLTAAAATYISLKIRRRIKVWNKTY